MSGYQIIDQEGIYFITFSVVQWVDIFSRSLYADIVVESLRFCQKEKGLIIYGWCIMSNHVHLIIRSNGMNPLSAILRDFKKFTAGKILKGIDHAAESRRSWMLWIFKSARENNPDDKIYQFWQQDNHPEELITNRFMQQKLDYLHNNPLQQALLMNLSIIGIAVREITQDNQV
ncbi:Transposase IS200 like protein [compost metagenome]